MTTASAAPTVAAAATAAPIATTAASADPSSTQNIAPALPVATNVPAPKLVGKTTADSTSRQNHVANARKHYGSSTPSFKSKCQALLSKLSSCENIQNEYLLATESRQEVCSGFFQFAYLILFHFVFALVLFCRKRSVWR